MTPLVGIVISLMAGGGLTLWVEPTSRVLPVAFVLGPGLLVVSARFLWAGHRHHACAMALLGSLLCGVAQARIVALRAWQPPGIDVAELETRTAGDARVVIEGVLRHDASPSHAGASLDLRVERIEIDDEVWRTDVGMRLSVGGEQAPGRLADWTRGRRLRMPVSSLRRPLPYRNFGVPDAERALARRGIRMFGGVKSASLVEWSPGPWWEEAAATVRARVRSAVRASIGERDAQAVVIAILIGDRTGLDPAQERRLQHAGVYHVIAISGGNVALFLAAIAWLPRWQQASVRAGTALLAIALLAFAMCVDGGASVARASLVAGAWLAARWWDLRTTALQAMACAAGLIVAFDPLALHDPGFLLSFGATFALVMLGMRLRIEGARQRPRSPLLRVLRATAMVLLATTAVELVLLPIAARWFSLVTGVGLVANLAALPAMAVVQAAGMSGVALWWVGVSSLADLCGVLAAAGVWVLLGCGSLVDALPALVREVPAPPLALVLGYFAALATTVATTWGGRDASPRRPHSLPRPIAPRRHLVGWVGDGVERLRDRVGRRGEPSLPGRRAVGATSGTCAVVLLALIIWGGPDRSAPTPWTWGVDTQVQTSTWPADPWLVITFLDVAQGDATVIRFPSGRTWLVDAGGTVAESTFDVGARVTVPALWALGHRQLSRVVLTHGHADHAGGLPAVMQRFRPREVLVGIPVPEDPVDRRVLDEARVRGIGVRRVRAGERFADGAVTARVLNPPAPDWARVTVRNDDSVVLWLRFGDVGVLLPGDAGRDVEAHWARAIPAAPLTVIKAGHHGSGSSTGALLLRHVPPRAVVVSAGRGNRFGHPHPDVLRRVIATGGRVWRTDEDGAIQMATNGRVLLVRTATGRVEVIGPKTAPRA